MVVLGINEFIRNMRRNALVIVQMIMIYMISIFVVSAFVEQYSLYAGMSNILDETGFVIESSSMEPTDNLVTYDDLMEHLIKVENIAITYRWDVTDESYEYKGIEDKVKIEVLTNNPELITYRPKLLEGEWCEDEPHKDGVINIAISNNMPFDFKVGETITIDDITFYVTGIFSSDELIYGYSNVSKNVEDMNYLDFYLSVTDASENFSEEKYLAVASYDDMMAEFTMRGINKIIIDFEDDISQEQIKQNVSILKERYGYTENADAYNAKVICDNSRTHLDVKLVPMVVLLAIILLILMVSMLTSSAVNVLYEKKNYGIYFICGNDWRKTFVISAIHWITVSVSSLMVAVSGCMLMKASGKFEQLTLTFTSTHVIVIAAVTVITLFVALLIPFNMLRKIQPVSILKDNDK